ncbi:hypothetical protein [Bacillus sp. FJAT-44742]|uniref:hypothetical protein n=1 Tax=Bacillus sp. FJAT-44742 TaxID=2014005 RepID=UPI0012FED4BD|nr:hypothetical protein [Bacillus sp. FJAT-44742]
MQKRLYRSILAGTMAAFMVISISYIMNVLNWGFVIGIFVGTVTAWYYFDFKSS